MKKLFVGLCLLGILAGVSSPALAHPERQNKHRYHQPPVKYYIPKYNYGHERNYHDISYYPQVRYYPRNYHNGYDNNALNIRIRLF